MACFHSLKFHNFALHFRIQNCVQNYQKTKKTKTTTSASKPLQLLLLQKKRPKTITNFASNFRKIHQIFNNFQKKNDPKRKTFRTKMRRQCRTLSLNSESTEPELGGKRVMVCRTLSFNSESTEPELGERVMVCTNSPMTMCTRSCNATSTKFSI